MSPSTSKRIDPENRSVPPVPDRPVTRAADSAPNPPTAPTFAYRIDPPHRVDPAQNAADESPSVDEIALEVANEPDWVSLHATDLVGHLQAWSADLDAREAQLNASLSQLEHRERRFRMLQQDAAMRLAEQQRAIDRIRAETVAQARRIAFE